MAELAAGPSSYYPTTSAAATRNADSLSFPWAPVPQAMWVYAKFTNLNLASGSDNRRVFQLGQVTGASTNTSTFLVAMATSNGFYAAYYNANGTQFTASTTNVVVLGDTVEVLALLSAAGAIQLLTAVNGGTQASGTESSAGVLPSAWGASRLVLGDKYAAAGLNLNAGFRVVKVGIGTSINTIALARAV
jgi:hypothetical protein